SFYTEPRTSDHLVAEIHAHFERVLRDAFAIPSSFFGAAGAAITFRVHPPPEWRFLIFGNIIDDQKSKRPIPRRTGRRDDEMSETQGGVVSVRKSMFDKLAPGMVLYDRHKHRMGNTT